jgi:hypothetical protein
MILKNRPSNPSQNRAVVSAPLINLSLGEYQLVDRTRMVGDREQQLIKALGSRPQTLIANPDTNSRGEYLAVRRKRERKHRSAGRRAMYSLARLACPKA